MDRNNTNGKPGSKLSSQDLARYQAELMWMHDKTIREIKEAKGMVFFFFPSTINIRA